MFVPPVVTDEAAGAAVLLTVVLLFVVSAFVNGRSKASRVIPTAAAKECLKLFFRATWFTIEIFLSFYTRIAASATCLSCNANPVA